MGILLHATNIHVGGGLYLLKYLVLTCPDSFSWIQLDVRVKNSGHFAEKVDTHWVQNSIWFRLLAEWRLYRRCSVGDTVLCFHGLPPLFPLRGRVVVFVQNRLLFDSSPLRGYPALTRLRLTGERWLTRLMAKNVAKYIVQTPSMEFLVRHGLGSEVSITVLPFMSKFMEPSIEVMRESPIRYDFVYVASGESHKNHGNLLAAWCLLAEAGLKPSLALTVDVRSYPLIASEVAKHRDRHGLNVVCLGKIESTDIAALYKSSAALIFPSKVESFGLPLIEATQLGLPVLAPELDYVRDVIDPVETFDPESPVSIARAVRRFLKVPDPRRPVGTAEDFLAEVLR